MIPFPFSVLVLPVAALLGVVYVAVTRSRMPALRRIGRVAVLAATWTSPLATQGPGPAQLTIGLLVGYLGIRMVALGERWRATRLPPSPGRVLAAMVVPEDLLHAAPAPAHPGHVFWRGMLLWAACDALLVAGNQVRIWHWSRAADDLLVFVEVAAGTLGTHDLIVGVAGLLGRPVRGMFDRPLLSASFSEFWARRWNHLVQANLHRGFFRPYARRRLWVVGTLAAFAASGVMHVLAVLDPARPVTFGPSVAVMGFFLLHGAVVAVERRLGLHLAPRGGTALGLARVRTVALLALTSPLMIEPFAKVVHVHGRVLGGP